MIYSVSKPLLAMIVSNQTRCWGLKEKTQWFQTFDPPNCLVEGRVVFPIISIPSVVSKCFSSQQQVCLKNPHITGYIQQPPPYLLFTSEERANEILQKIFLCNESTWYSIQGNDAWEIRFMGGSNLFHDADHFPSISTYHTLVISSLTHKYKHERQSKHGLMTYLEPRWPYQRGYAWFQ